MSITDITGIAQGYCNRYLQLVSQLDTGEIFSTSPEVKEILAKLETFIYSIRRNSELREEEARNKANARKAIDALLDEELKEEVDKRVTSAINAKFYEEVNKKAQELMDDPTFQIRPGQQSKLS